MLEAKLQLPACLDKEDKKGSRRSVAPPLHKTGIKICRGSSVGLWSISLAEAADLNGLIWNDGGAANLYGGWKPP